MPYPFAIRSAVDELHLFSLNCSTFEIPPIVVPLFQSRSPRVGSKEDSSSLCLGSMAGRQGRAPAFDTFTSHVRDFSNLVVSQEVDRLKFDPLEWFGGRTGRILDWVTVQEYAYLQS